MRPMFDRLLKRLGLKPVELTHRYLIRYHHVGMGDDKTFMTCPVYDLIGAANDLMAFERGKYIFIDSVSEVR